MASEYDQRRRPAIDHRRPDPPVLVGIIGGSLLAGHYGWIRPLRPLYVDGTLLKPLGLSPAIWCIGLGIAFLVAFVQWEGRQNRLGGPTLVPPTVLLLP